MENLILVPLDDSILFPGMSATIAVETGDEERVLLVPRTEGEFAAVGTIADVVEHMRIPGGGSAVTVEGVARGVPGAANTDSSGALRVEVTVHRDPEPNDEHVRTLQREYRAVVEEILDLRGADARIRAFLRSITGPGPLADTSGYSPDLSLARARSSCWRRSGRDGAARRRALELQRERLAELQVRAKIRDDVQEGAERQQREYFLRKQMESIRKELGEDEGSVAEEYRTKIEEAGMPDAVREQAEKELAAPGAHGRLIGRVVDDPHLPRLAGVGAVVEALGRAARPGACARGARRRPRGARGRQGPHHRVHRRAQAAPRARHDRGGPRRRRDPDADRTCPAPARPRSASRSRVRPDASSCACRWAASATRPRSAVTAERTSGRCRAGWFGPSATPAR